MNRCDEVIRLADIGYRMVPWSGRKSATDSSAPLISWSTQRLSKQEVAAWCRLRPDADWAILPEGNVAVFDLEMKNGLNGVSDTKALCASLGVCADSVLTAAQTRTKSGGYHIWMQTSQPLVGGLHIRPGIEAKGANGTVHVPPSFGYHAQRPLPNPRELPHMPLALEREWIQARNTAGGSGRQEYKRILFPEGQRRRMLCSVAGKLRAAIGMDKEELFAALIAVRDRRCENPTTMTDDEILTIAASFAKKDYQDDASAYLAPDEYSDAINGLLNR